MSSATDSLAPLQAPLRCLCVYICVSGHSAQQCALADAQGGSDKGFFRRLERLVFRITGAEPRCWYEPRYDWQEDTDVAAET